MSTLEQSSQPPERSSPATGGPPAPSDPFPTLDPAAAANFAASAGFDPAQVQVVYDTLPQGVFVVYRGNPARLLINEAWWRDARPVERIQALESLWARLQAIPAEAWGASDVD